MKRIYVIILICIMLIGALTGCKSNNEDTLNNVKNNDIMEIYNTDDIVALSEVWMRAKQISPFWDEVRNIEWDRLYEQSLNKLMALKTKESSQYNVYEIFEEFVSFLDDGHVNVIPSKKQYNCIGYLPYNFTYSGGKYYVEYKTEDAVIPLGSEIIKINDVSASSYISTQRYIIPVKTKGAYEYAAIKRISVGKLNSTVKLSYIDSITGKKEEVKLSYDIKYNDVNNCKWESIKSSHLDIEPLYSSANYTLKSFDTVAYLNISTFMSEDMVEEFYNNVFPLIRNFDSLLIDIRNNGGGNAYNGHNILELLTGVKADYGKSYSQYNNVYDIAAASAIEFYKTQHMKNTVGLKMLKNLNIVETSTLNNHLEIDKTSLSNLNMENHETFKGKIGILMSYKTGSAGEDFAMFAKQIEQCKLYGTNTKGATGLIAVFELKNNMIFSLSSLDSRTNEDIKIQNIGIKPDFYVELEIDKLIKGVDTQIEYAIMHMKGE